MAHIALRHATRHATREQIITQANAPFQTGMPVQQSTAVPIGFLAFARAFQLQADKLAAGIVAEAGYDPAEMARYLERQPPGRATPGNGYAVPAGWVIPCVVLVAAAQGCQAAGPWSLERSATA